MTNLGKFLTALRRERGFESVARYAERYKLPVSEAYYRSLEAGRKVIALETAESLCRALEADEQEFYIELLHDYLPRLAIEKLVPQSSDDGSIAARGKQDSTFEEGMMRLSQEAINYFKTHEDCMPVLAFLYARGRDGISKKDLTRFMNEMKVNANADEVIGELLRMQLASFASDSNGTVRICKTKRDLDWNDSELEERLIKMAVEGRFDQPPPIRVPFEQGGRFGYYGFVGIPASKYQEILAKYNELIAILEASKGEFANPGEEPFFYTAIFATRPEYASGDHHSPSLDDQRKPTGIVS
jgi:hypothetical protein